MTVRESVNITEAVKFPQKTILLVDDDGVILESLGCYLRKSGYHVIIATSGEDALLLADTACFDLVVTDLIMGGIDGLTVLQELKKLCPECCVFILTGQANVNVAVSALRSGVDDFLLKPCDPDELLIRIERAFEKQETQKTLKIYEKILPICMYCRKIRNDSGKKPGTGEWMCLEDYFKIKGNIKMSHGVCPECYARQIKSLTTDKMA